MCEPYNGWRNYETWVFKIYADDCGAWDIYGSWANNFALHFNYGKTIRLLAEDMKAETLEALDCVDIAVGTIFSELLIASVQQIDFNELARAVIGDYCDLAFSKDGESFCHTPPCHICEDEYAREDMTESLEEPHWLLCPQCKAEEESKVFFRR